MMEGKNPWTLTTQERLDRKRKDENDFVSLAIAGESLRKWIDRGLVDEEALEVLDAYESFLKKYRGPTPSDRRLKWALRKVRRELEHPPQDEHDHQWLEFELEEVGFVIRAKEKCPKWE
jgi:hypothetical protein